MFDVSWVDPARETVGERRNRKEQKPGTARSKKENRFPQKASSKSSISSGATTTGLKSEAPPGTAFSEWTKVKSHLEPPIRGTAYDEQISVNSVRSDSPTLNWLRDGNLFDSRQSEAQSDVASEIQRPSTTISVKHGNRASTDRSLTPESISWSSVTDSLAPCSRTNSYIVQPLSPGSFVSQSIEVVVAQRDTLKYEQEVTTTAISISAAGSPSPGEQPIERDSFFRPISRNSLTRDEPQTIEYSHPQLKIEPFFVLDDVPHPRSSGPGSSIRLAAISSQASIHSHTQNHQSTTPAWEAPKSWEYFTRQNETPSPPLTCTSSTTQPFVNESPPLSPRLHLASQKAGQKSPTLPTEFEHIRRNILLMRTASKKTMLERLREDWTGNVDATMQRELEIHKHICMETAMRQLANLGSCERRRGDFESGRIPSSAGKGKLGETIDKMLSLFESHASTSYLAVTIPSGAELHHLSPTPISPVQFPNTMPLTVPAPMPHLPYAANIFSSIHASCLASLFPSPAIPKMLRECHRVLASPSSHQRFTTGSSLHSGDGYFDSEFGRGGTLHLKIIDPYPICATLGPLLQEWLDTHLGFDLEKQFRCLHPVRMFPGWLSEAGLDAEGSQITQMTFLASFTDSPKASEPRVLRRKNTRGEAEPNFGGGRGGRLEEQEEDNVTRELKTVVGREVWKEIWGTYVQLKGGRWWWEEREILDECWERGTLWEYAIIEAVKA